MGQSLLFDDDEWDAPVAPSTSTPENTRKISGGASPEKIVELVTAIPDLRVTPVGRDKLPLEKGWASPEYWHRTSTMADRVRAWIKQYGAPNFAVCLGAKCTKTGALVVEADNQAGEDWCKKNLPATPIMNVTRRGYVHRYYVPDVIDASTGLVRGNYIDAFGAKRRWMNEATAAGFEVKINPRQRQESGYLAHVAKQREEATAQIEMGPLIDIKCQGGQAMAPYSVHESGYVYTPVDVWTQSLWDARPEFEKTWFPDEVWAAREAARLLSLQPKNDAHVDAYWTNERRIAAARKYVLKVPPKSTGENSSATFMRLATVLVRGFWLEPQDARELATYWAKEVCGHEPWTRKEIEHKLYEAQTRGDMEWGEMLRERTRVPEARLEAAEKAVEDMIAGRVAREQDFVHDLDFVPLPKGFTEAREPDEVQEPLGYGPPGDDLVRRGDVLVRETDVEKPVNLAAAAEALLERDPETAPSQALVAVTSSNVFDDDDAATGDDDMPGYTAPSDNTHDQLRRVFAHLGIDLTDIRKVGALYHTRTDRDGNVIALDTTTTNLKLVFLYSKLFKGKFRLNTMSEEQEYEGERITDAMEARLKDVCDGLFMREVPADRVNKAILLACDHARYDPVREYVDSLPPWDGVERWRQLPEHVLFVQDGLEHAKVLVERFGFAAMARALRPGEKVDTMLVLQSSAQGLFKSTFAKELFGAKFFSEQPINIHDKDSRLVMARNWCMEVGEGDILSQPSEVRRLKQFLSQARDDIRLPYGRRVINIPRRCMFIATTNETRLLHDSTGDRRFWIVTPGKEIDLEKLREWRDQLWAEARHRVLEHWNCHGDRKKPEYGRGQWWLTADEQKNNDANNVSRQFEDAWEPDVYEFLDKQGRNPFLVTDVLKHLNVNIDRRDWLATRRVIELLRRTRCTQYQNGKVTHVAGRQGRFWEPPAVLPSDDKRSRS